jgi:hypothetical protein
MKSAVLGGATLLVGERVAAAPARNATFNIVPIQITNVSLNAAQNGLVAAGLVGNNPFGNLPITLSASPNQAAPECPILNLQLGPIDLNLLGLRVQTSPICLRITAVPGALLGDLLCGLANALSGIGLAAFLAGLTDLQRGILLGALAALLSQALGAATSSQAAPAVSGADCEILTLSLGPLDLNLLGLRVQLDDCNGGPVVVTITAIPGQLLGDLLCGLANLLNGRGGLNQIARQLQAIANAIGQLVGALG